MRLGRRLHASLTGAPIKGHSMAEIVAQEDIPPLFRPSCRDCAFCDGLKDMDCEEKGPLGVLRLEEEENRDGVEDAGDAHNVVKGRRRNANRRRKVQVLTTC
jgi:hypothetical protein